MIISNYIKSNYSLLLFLKKLLKQNIINTMLKSINILKIKITYVTYLLGDGVGIRVR